MGAPRWGCVALGLTDDCDDLHRLNGAQIQWIRCARGGHELAGLLADGPALGRKHGGQMGRDRG
jgi:hypothetical protein